MTVINEGNLIHNMSQAYNAHFIKNANAGEALVHMMQISKIDHPNLRSINPNEILVSLSRGMNLSTREKLQTFTSEVIVYLIKDVVGSKLTHEQLMAMTKSKIKT